MVILLLACVTELGSPESAAPLAQDEAEVTEALRRVDHEQALRVLDGLLDRLESADCPVLHFSDGDGQRQLWTACGDDAGTVERYEDAGLAWIEVSGLVVDGLVMDGAIEHVVFDELSTLEWAATFCEGDCSDPVQVDLSWTLVDDADGMDVLVSGTLATAALGPVAVEGTWHLEPARCDGWPASGLLLVEGAHTHALRFDAACDGCAEWGVDGTQIGSYCDVAL